MKLLLLLFVTALFVQLQFVNCAAQLVIVVVRLGTQEAEGLSKSDVAKRMKVTASLI